MGGEGPLYLQVYNAVRAHILSGQIAVGELLPPTRKLAKELGVSRNVVMIAYDQLKAEGYAEGQIGGGTRAIVPDEDRIQINDKKANSRPEMNWQSVVSERAITAHRHWQERQRLHRFVKTGLPYDFRYGDVAADPTTLKIWRKLTAQYLSRPEIDYGDAQGVPELREAIASYVTHARGCRCSADQICIVGGSQQAVDLICRLLITRGDQVLMEDPVYQGSKSVFEVAGAEIVSVPVDEQGLDTAYLSERIDQAKLIYVTPSHQFPTGAVMSLKRRLALLQWAEQQQAFVVEDDYDSEFRYTGKPIESLQGMDNAQRVIYIGTLSKVMFPALRLGYMVLPEPLVQPLLGLRWLTDRQTVSEQQHVLAKFLSEGHFERHLRRMRRRYSSRRQTLLASLEHHFGQRIKIQGTNAGLHLLAWFDHIPWSAYEEIALSAHITGVGIHSVNQFYQQAPSPMGLLMGYASLDEEEIAEGGRKTRFGHTVIRGESLMSGSVGLYLIAIAGGIAVAIQAQMMGVMDKGIGTLESVFITYGVGSVLIGLVMLAVKGGNLSAWSSIPSYNLLAGVVGLVIVASIGYASPRLGLVAAFTLIIAAQFIVGALFDHFGWLGAEIRAITPTRVAGLMVILFGVWLTLKK